MMRPTSVPIPARMRHLPKDARGYPAAVIVMTTDDGAPIFAANDEGERQRMFKQDRCHVCGDRLLRGRWFVGGCLSTCAEHGLILDGGMHSECAAYALAVCPYLAAPNYGRLVGRQQLAKSDRANVMVMDTGTDGNPRPDMFVALMAVAEEYSHGSAMPGIAEMEIIYGVRPKPGAVRQVELWRHGRQISDPVEVEAMRADIDAQIRAAGDRMRADVAKLLCSVKTTV